ncbi:MAG TPA: zinc metallopeptidase [Candidatus Pullichristensenella excrementipullorum]|nr:zinc metallopeptidase [Candidatus Pullichristensenella excrementipullorum]
MYFPFFYDWTYLLLIPALLLSLWAQFRVSSTFNRFSKVRASSGMTATQMAEQLLHAEGVYDVSVERTRGNLTDHYDPKNMVLRLSDSTANSTSVAALGVAAHEAGHVLQHRDGYAPLMLRTAAVPVVNIGSNLSWPLFLVGLIFSWEPLLYAGIALFALAVLFALITLPVEFNASKRALAALEANGYLQPGEEMRGAKKVLSAAAMTYVASAFMAIMQLLRLLAIAGVRRDD